MNVVETEMNAILLQKQNAKFLDIQNAKKGEKGNDGSI